MSKRLIVSDIDGTFLKTDKSVSPKTQAKIEALMSEGHPFAIATGRMFAAGKMITEKFDYDGFLIACNGALVKHLKTGEVIQSIPIDKEKVKQVIDICHHYHAYFHLYAVEDIYAEENKHLVKRYVDSLPVLPEHLKFNIHFLGNVRPVADQVEIYKFGVYSEDPEVFQKVTQEINALGGLETCMSLTTSFDVNAEGVTKAKGIEALCDYYKLPVESVIAFGDNENDTDMIKYAGVGVAMANATEALKAHADFVTLSNDEDGLVYALDQLIEE